MARRSKKTGLLRDAAEWRLISLLFDCPVGDWQAQVKTLAAEANDPQLRTAAEFARAEAGEGLFHSIFGPGGPAPGREVSYRGWVEPGYLLSELSSFYDAFSYEPATSEVLDHVTVETGFIAYLKLKELYALECGDNEKAEIASNASTKFIDEHLSKFAEKLSRLLASSGLEYLELAGAALFARVGPDKDRSKQIYLPVLEAQEDELMFECGGAA